VVLEMEEEVEEEVEVEEEMEVYLPGSEQLL
jgi:hypothetical protein